MSACSVHTQGTAVALTLSVASYLLVERICRENGDPWSLPYTTAFHLLCIARFISAAYSIIPDCDESQLSIPALTRDTFLQVNCY